MANLKTSKGYLEYDSRLLYFGNKVLEPEPMLENLKILALYLDKIDINWEPAFGTLIGIVRNDDFQPWKPIFDIYILKEDEEFLSFQYGDWTVPKQTVVYSRSIIKKYYHWTSTWLQDHLPAHLYYQWILYRRQADFARFKARSEKAGVPIPENVQLASMQPRKYRRVLTVGVYDLIHKGHVELFRRAKGLGDYLIVATQDSDYILKYKALLQFS